MRAGTYTGNYTAGNDGTLANRIAISAYTGEKPVINGTLSITGDYVTITGIEIKNTGWTEGRESTQAGAPWEIATPNILIPSGDNIEMINCILHDGSQGAGWFGQGGTMYGCLIYHNGLKSTASPQGHGVYPQNNTPRKTLKHNIIFDNFGWGVHGYTSDVGKQHRITLDGNIIFNNGSVFGAAYPNFTLENTAEAEAELTVINNLTYQPAGEATQNAIGNSAATDVTFTDNYTPEHTEVGGVANFLANSGNYDGASGIGDQVFVIANDYDATRCHVAIYNQAEAATVDVDVSAVYSNGDTIKVYNVQDYPNDVQTLTVTLGVITVNMQAANRTVAAPYGWTAPAKSFPQFGAFVAVKQ